MDFETWELVYEAILADFGYDRAADERARDYVAALYERRGVEPYRPQTDSFVGKTVAIAGGAASLLDEISVIREADAVVAASTAADRLREIGLDVDLLVTDLDKHPTTVRDLTKDGVPVAVHAHGDNVPALRQYVPTFAMDRVVPTTQAEPVGVVVNVGGFTDGDRAAFLADHLGARRLVFPGWDFDDMSVGAEKRKKLEWAERLLYWLEQRRDERFEVLDDRREQIDVSALP